MTLSQCFFILKKLYRYRCSACVCSFIFEAFMDHKFHCCKDQCWSYFCKCQCYL